MYFALYNLIRVYGNALTAYKYENNILLIRNKEANKMGKLEYLY